MLTRVIEQLQLTGGLSDISEVSLRSIQAAALFHDLGHWPFSHSLEAVRGLIDHEDNGTIILLEDPQIGAILRRWGLSPRRIAELIVPPEGGYQQQEDMLLHSLLSADTLGFDADRMEYLGRDAWLCGRTPEEWAPIEKLLSSMRIHEGVYEMERGIVITPKGIKPLSDALLLRGKLRGVSHSWQIRSAEAMTVRATELVRGDRADDSPLSNSALRRLGDNELLDQLASSGVSEARDLANGIREGRLYRPLIEWGPEDAGYHKMVNLSAEGVRDVARILPEVWGVAAHKVLVDVPVRLSKGKIDLLVRYDDGSLTPWSEVTEWTEEHKDPRKVRVLVDGDLEEALSPERASSSLMSVLQGR
ncbi:hypothetical protein [Ktedonospora formicarum]